VAKPAKTVTLSDPRALRAFAHPARQTLLNELLHGRVVTATEAADIVGMSPSAVSHHLRALEKYGLVERAGATDDGRERPWRATAQRINLAPPPGPAADAAMIPIISLLLQQFTEELQNYLAHRHDEPWSDDYAGLSRAELWLTQEETHVVGAAIEAAVAPYQRRHARRHPKRARRTGLTVSLVPLEPPPS
jgi:DNA-binding transcriptional ArsR family regulator